MNLISTAEKKVDRDSFWSMWVYVYRTTDRRNSGEEHIGTKPYKYYSVSPSFMRYLKSRKKEVGYKSIKLQDVYECVYSHTCARACRYAHVCICVCIKIWIWMVFKYIELRIIWEGFIDEIKKNCRKDPKF